MTMNQSPEPRAWLVRGSKDERFDPWMLEHGYTGVGFREVPRLDQAPDLPTMRQLIRTSMQNEKAGAVGNYAAQLNAFANKIATGDIIVLPSTKTYCTLLVHAALFANSNETMPPIVLGRCARVLRPILALALACLLY